MQKAPKQKRYWSGKAPDWVEEAQAAAAAAPQSKPPPPPRPSGAPATAAGAPPTVVSPNADPRLLRLMQQKAQADGQGASEAVVVQRRRLPSPEAEEPAPLRSALAASPEAEDDDEEAIAARRMAIRMRQLATVEAAAAASDVEEGSTDASEYSTDDSEDDGNHVMLKPAFVHTAERETLAEREAILAKAQQSTRQQSQQLEDRKQQTQALVIQAQQQAAQESAPVQDAADVDTDDDMDEVAQYEDWRERELRRIARDRQLRQAGTKAEAALTAAPSSLAASSLLQPKKKWNFLQKYWHKGAFFQGDEEEEPVLGGVMQRDYDAPTGEDKFDKQMLPKIMQVRNFGRRGRTKWTHLLAEDTSMQAIDSGAPPTGTQLRQPSQDFAKPRTHKT